MDFQEVHMLLQAAADCSEKLGWPLAVVMCLFFYGIVREMTR